MATDQLTSGVDVHQQKSSTKEQSPTGLGIETVEEKPATKKPRNFRKFYNRNFPIFLRGKIPIPEQRSVSHEYGASIWSQFTFSWLGPLMATGYLRPLELNDIWLINPDRDVTALTERFAPIFRKRVADGDIHPLLKALYETFKTEFWIGGVCRLLADLFQIFAPFSLRFLISFSTKGDTSEHDSSSQSHYLGSSLGLAFSITIMLFIQSLGSNQFTYRGTMVGAQARAVLTDAIFDKSMRLSGRAQAGGIQEVDDYLAEGDSKLELKVHPGWGNGRIMNLMATDTSRIEQGAAMLHLIWTAPVTILLALALLAINIHYSALAGYAFLFVTVPLLTISVKSFMRRRKKMHKITDERVGLTQEVLTAIKFVKYFAWEYSFLDRLEAIRKTEIRGIQGLLAVKNAIQTVSLSLPIFASMLSFITLTETSQTLIASHIFSSLAIFNAIRLPLNQLPLVIGQVADAWSSIARIQEFLLAEERENYFGMGDATDKADYAIQLEHADFTWESSGISKETAVAPIASGEIIDTRHEENSDSQNRTGQQRKPLFIAEKDTNATLGEHVNSIPIETPEILKAPMDGGSNPFKLRDMNFKVNSSELLAVIGSVGCGKSSLLAALAGEMRMTEGRGTVIGSKAFCPQYAWMQNTTVRENIIFGKPFDKEFYWRVVEACALEADLEILPNGDKTEIGERGINLSGGQKQRINIARAIYSKSDIILMDDPLSAVDAHVGRHIFDNAISGLLKHSCRILATHQVHILNRCDRVLWLQDGQIAAIDTFDNLIATNTEFARLMLSTSQDLADDREVVVDAPKIEKTQTQEAPLVELMQKEERSTGSVPWSVYFSYLGASGSLWNGLIFFFFLVISQISNIATNVWLSFWIQDKFGLRKDQYIGIYAGIAVLQLTLFFTYGLSVAYIGARASRTLFNTAMVRTFRAPMSFFETTPLGRITNRFSKDVDVMDNNLSDAIRLFAATMGTIITSLVLVIVFLHVFAAALIPAFLLFLLAVAYYRASARQIKRHEAVLRSVVHARFNEGLTGASYIRAYGIQENFLTSLRNAINDMNSASFLACANSRWLCFRVDTVGNLLVLLAAILIATTFHDSASDAGLVISSVLPMVQMMQSTVRQFAEVENSMNSVERIQHYCTELEEEAPLHTVQIPESWPARGEIKFEHVQMKYRANLPLVLHGMNLHIKGGEHVGIVGRTGAGKSSILSVLFRLLELTSGSITIDGLNISTIGLHDLRSHLAIIPQDPTLFKGTIRSNIDPFNEHSDTELWSALRQSNLLSDQDDSQRLHLESPVTDEGLNYSLGQRQLLAFARALLRGSQIVVCDEATSSVDIETDKAIQQTIMTAFKGKTLLCIAHRLRTIIHYDKVCVVDKGVVVEWDNPLALYSKEGSIFRSMCVEGGINLSDFNVDRCGD